MRKIKSYLLFTSIPYRIVVMALFPLLLYILTYTSKAPGIGNIVKISLFVAVEVFADFWVFGGICSKDFKGMEYMKSSVKGRQVLKDALVTDVVRKLIWLAAVVFGSAVNGKAQIQGTDFLYMMTVVLFGHSFILFGNILGRYVTFYPVTMMISWGASAMACVFLVLSSIWLIPMFVLSIACCVCAGWLSVWNVMRRVERSYYDTTA